MRYRGPALEGAGYEPHELKKKAHPPAPAHPLGAAAFKSIKPSGTRASTNQSPRISVRGKPAASGGCPFSGDMQCDFYEDREVLHPAPEGCAIKHRVVFYDGVQVLDAAPWQLQPGVPQLLEGSQHAPTDLLRWRVECRTGRRLRSGRRRCPMFLSWRWLEPPVPQEP